MKNRILFILLALVLALSVVLIGCAPKEEEEENILKIGGLFALSGDMSTAEIMMKDGAVLCQEWINENGGITVNGETYLIELIIEDTKSTADGAVAAATKLVHEDQVKFVIGMVRPSEIIPAQTVTEPAGVLFALSWGGGIPAVMNPDTPFTFRPVLSGAEMIPVLYDYLVEAYPDVETVAILNPDEPGGQYFTHIAADVVAPAHNLTVVGSALHVPGTEDYYALLSDLLELDPDALDLGTGNPMESGLKFKQARELGFTGPCFSCAPCSLGNILIMVGNESAYDYFNVSLDMGSPDVPPMMLELKERWEDKFGTDFEPYWESFQGWDPLWCLVQAIEAAQSLDPAVVKTAWENMESIETCYGTGHMGGLETYGIKHLVVRRQCVSRLEDGQVELIKWFMPEFP